MPHSNLNMDEDLAQTKLTESWAKEAARYNVKDGTLDAALHKMSQNVTVMLTTLELFQMTGEVLPEDLDVLMTSAVELRDYIKMLRGGNSSEIN